MDFGAKLAVVTGGSRGIGRAIVERLRRDGFKVVTCGRGTRPEFLHEGIAWLSADVSSTEDSERLIRCAEKLGRLSLLVNNAGVQVEKTVRETTDDHWNAVVGINCKGVFNMCRAALPGMVVNGGVIVNIGSIAGNISEPGMALYNASKAFVHSLTRSIAVDHGPKLRCNSISPGWIATELTDSAFAVAREPDRAKIDALARHPASRLGLPADVANVVSWLASDQSEFLTGQCLTLDGGLTVGSPIQPGLF